MTNVFIGRPPKPGYIFLWNVEKVLKYLNDSPNNLDLPMKFLPYKFTILFALTTSSRSFEICF